LEARIQETIELAMSVLNSELPTEFRSLQQSFLLYFFWVQLIFCSCWGKFTRGPCSRSWRHWFTWLVVVIMIRHPLIRSLIESLAEICVIVFLSAARMIDTHVCIQIGQKSERHCAVLTAIVLRVVSAHLIISNSKC